MKKVILFNWLSPSKWESLDEYIRASNIANILKNKWSITLIIADRKVTAYISKWDWMTLGKDTDNLSEIYTIITNDNKNKNFLEDKNDFTGIKLKTKKTIADWCNVVAMIIEK